MAFQVKPPSKRRLPRKISADYLRNAGLFYLERFPSSVANFRRVMTQKVKKSCKAHPDLIEPDCLKLLENTIQDFIQKGYLNDELYSKGLITTLQRRGLSERMIKQRLTQKGLHQTSLESDDYLSALRLLQRRKRGPFATQQNEDETKRSFGILGRAGFDYAVCQKALNTSAAEADDMIKEAQL